MRSVGRHCGSFQAIRCTCASVRPTACRQHPRTHQTPVERLEGHPYRTMGLEPVTSLTSGQRILMERGILHWSVKP